MLASCSESDALSSGDGDTAQQDGDGEFVPYKIQGEPETRPTLYYQNQKYDLLHTESNKIDVSGMLLKKDGPIGTIRYPGAVLLADLDASDARRAGDEVYVHPEKADALIYHCSDCNQYFCITTAFVPMEEIVESEDPQPNPMDPGTPAPGMLYTKGFFDLAHFEENKIDPNKTALKFAGITRYAGKRMTQDFDVNDSLDAGIVIYTTATGKLVYYCDHCDSYMGANAY